MIASTKLVRLEAGKKKENAWKIIKPKNVRLTYNYHCDIASHYVESTYEDGIKEQIEVSVVSFSHTVPNLHSVAMTFM